VLKHEVTKQTAFKPQMNADLASDVVRGNTEEFGAEQERDKKDESDEKRGLQARTHKGRSGWCRVLYDEDKTLTEGNEGNKGIRFNRR
jgi:hypothetical protein